jgi:endonuclease/exonuclease/phosphatase family metal-dependent hydrolase
MVQRPPMNSQNSKDNRTHRQALDTFGDFLSDQRTVMIGDFNSSSRVLVQKDSHPAFMTRAGALGLRSIYHTQTGQPHGGEKVHTYRHHDAVKSRFHLNYCFLSTALLDSASMRVLDNPKREARSDHYPIVVDLTGDSKPG